MGHALEGRANTPSLVPVLELELVTPPLDGIILPGVVRQSLLDLARTWVRVGGVPCVGAGVQRHVSIPSLWVRRPPWASFTALQQGVLCGLLCLCPCPQGEFRVAERTITMQELLRALEEGRVREVFGSGTACQVCPVHRILYKDKVRRGRRCGRERRGHAVLMAPSSPAPPHSHHGKWA